MHIRQTALWFALGCATLLGAKPAPLRAAEWSMTPVYTLTADRSTNRYLDRNAVGSESGVLTGDIRFQYALENLQMSL